jgi:hypothetical protein
MKTTFVLNNDFPFKDRVVEKTVRKTSHRQSKLTTHKGVHNSVCRDLAEKILFQYPTHAI